MAVNTTIIRWGRSIGMAGLIFAASGMLQIAGVPLFDVVGEVALNLAAVQSEAEKLRRRVGLLRLGRIQLELATQTPRPPIDETQIFAQSMPLWATRHLNANALPRIHALEKFAPIPMPG